MRLQKHIINKQILEIQMPTTANTSQIQEDLILLCRNQLAEVMDRVFYDVNTSDLPLQIEQLTLDLGTVSLENFETAFTQKLQEILSEYNHIEDVPKKQKHNDNSDKTALRYVIHYLKTGVLPWWAKQGNKTEFQVQLEHVLQRPNRTLINFLKELQWDTLYLQRFVNASTEQQLVTSFKLITGLSNKDILKMKDRIQHKIQKKYAIEVQKLQHSFWKIAFLKYHMASVEAEFQQTCSRLIRLDLGIDHQEDSIQPNPQYVYAYKTLVSKCKLKYVQNPTWEAFFKQLSELGSHPYFDQLPAQLLKQIVQLLQDLENSKKQTSTNIPIDTLLNPLATSLKRIQIQLKNIASKPTSMVSSQITSNFEDTDFITIQNSGLVLFWPFLERYFENLGFMNNKCFINQTAQHSAICALQYLCDSVEENVFEGLLPLNKLLCGLEVEDVISRIELSKDEKDIGKGLLTAVIRRGPKWKNLSLEGFRSSYLCRQGSLRTRDGHWLLQVERQTHDITLEKLPWGFHTIKLPWMQEIIVVEWL